MGNVDAAPGPPAHRRAQGGRSGATTWEVPPPPSWPSLQLVQGSCAIKRVIAGKLKMQHDLRARPRAYAQAFRTSGWHTSPGDRDVVLAPPFTADRGAQPGALRSGVKLSSQTVTGNSGGGLQPLKFQAEMPSWSSRVLRDRGHSENPANSNCESDEKAKKKSKTRRARNAQAAGLIAIVLAWGETEASRSQLKTERVIRRQ